ncbi:MAG: hypothetical protein IJ263_05220 [Paludibacteraceae bacterium]|nr:hypothetical protein [Paludibacteraceae bacterium]MBQ8019784.1 hypothetical protein [Paludibacteraceae bacterium]MBR6596680.1 hypothetical protein [Paludibacteraceae bacterium]
MSVWRIGSRWSKKGDETKSLIQVFIKNKVVFCGSDVADEDGIKSGDIVAIADGHKIIAVCRAITDQAKVSGNLGFTSTDIENLGNDVFEIIKHAVGVKVDNIIKLSEPITYNYPATMTLIQDAEVRNKVQEVYDKCTWSELD